MIQITVAKHIAFCFGVKRAFNLVNIYDKKNKNIFILGSLAHNPTVEKQITNWGITKIDNLTNIKKDDIVIITAHGIAPQYIKKIQEKQAHILDTTCPKVAKIHAIAHKYFKENYQIIIFGDASHKEVIGINGNCNNSASIVKDIGELKQTLPKIDQSKPICLISQTTQNLEKYETIKKYVRSFSKKNNIKSVIFNTICSATEERQKEIATLAKNHEAIIIVGGTNSGNTKRLYEIASKLNNNTICIDELNSFSKKIITKRLTNVKTLAIISGASTPMIEINKIIRFIKSINE